MTVCARGGATTTPRAERPTVLSMWVAGFGGERCQECTQSYYGRPPRCTYCDALLTCRARGTCRSVDGSCECRSGFAGKNCEFSDAEDCSGLGRVQRDGSCKCNTGFSGERCLSCDSDSGYYGVPPLCTFCERGDTCSGHGSCTLDGVGGSPCSCHSGYTGPHCQFSDALSCSGGGVVHFNSSAAQPAADPLSSYVCVCEPRYGGAACERCNTEAGYYGQFPNCAFCDAATSCSGHGSCDPESGQCVCEQRFSGEDCGSCHASAPFGYPQCRACSRADLCNGHGRCDADGSCSCDDGWSGERCDSCAEHHFNPPSCKACQPATTCNGTLRAALCRPRVRSHHSPRPSASVRRRPRRVRHRGELPVRRRLLGRELRPRRLRAQAVRAQPRDASRRWHLRLLQQLRLGSRRRQVLWVVRRGPLQLPLVPLLRRHAHVQLARQLQRLRHLRVRGQLAHVPLQSVQDAQTSHRGHAVLGNVDGHVTPGRLRRQQLQHL